MHCNNYLYPVIKGCFKQNYKNPNQCLTYNFRAMLNIDLDNLMLWQILHPIPPCISFSLLPPNPCVCNLVYRESQSKGMVPYRVLTNHPSCKLKGAGKRRGWGRGRRGGGGGEDVARQKALTQQSGWTPSVSELSNWPSHLGQRHLQ